MQLSFVVAKNLINQFTVNRYIESCPCSRFRNNLVRLVKTLAGEFKMKNLCSILKFVYRQLKLCIVLTVYFFLFFYCRNKMKYSQLVSRFVLDSKLFGPGNQIQSLAMPMSVMNVNSLSCIFVMNYVVFNPLAITQPDATCQTNVLLFTSAFNLLNLSFTV